MEIFTLIVEGLWPLTNVRKLSTQMFSEVLDIFPHIFPIKFLAVNFTGSLSNPFPKNNFPRIVLMFCNFSKSTLIFSEVLDIYIRYFLTLGCNVKSLAIKKSFQLFFSLSPTCRCFRNRQDKFFCQCFIMFYTGSV